MARAEKVHLSYSNTRKPRSKNKNSLSWHSKALDASAQDCGEPRVLPDRWPVGKALLFMLVTGVAAWTGIVFLVV